MNKQLFFILLILISLSWSCKNDFKRLDIYKSNVSIEVPSEWAKVQDNFETFKDRNVLFKTKVSGNAPTSALELKVYDSTHIYSATITPSIIENFKQVQLTSRSANTSFTASGIKNVNGISVGYLKYLFANSDSAKHFGARLFFKSPLKEFFEIEIYDLNANPKDSERIIDRITESLKLSFN